MLVSIDMSERERKRKKDIPSNNSFTERANPSRFLKKISTFFVKWRRQGWKYNRVIYTSGLIPFGQLPMYQQANLQDAPKITGDQPRKVSMYKSCQLNDSRPGLVNSPRGTDRVIVIVNHKFSMKKIKSLNFSSTW